tara:strand:- start:2933 stop:3118 length:186 start_codon:yes stop_codon:yes gene_type:complete
MKKLSMTSEEMTYLYETLRWRSMEFKDTDLKRDVKICKKVMSLIEDEMLAKEEGDNGKQQN